MFRRKGLAIGLIVISMWHQAGAIDPTRDPSLVAKLTTAATQLDRLALLPNSADWVFDFTLQKPYYNFRPGGVTNMNPATFPAARKNGLTPMVNLGPCGMLPPHYHPRAANWVVAITGNTTTFMHAENGAHSIRTNLVAGQATIFPAGSMHMMYNDCCEPAQLVSALNSEDAGTENIGSIFTNGFPFDWVNAAFGSSLADQEVADRMIPVGTGANWGTKECLERCRVMPRDGRGMGGGGEEE